MNKSIYSLVLSDDIISELDKLAYRQGMSRSGIINDILAEYISYTTPEMHARNLFSQIESLMLSGNVFRSMLPATDTMIKMCSALEYKYNPSVRYCIELYKTVKAGEPTGEFRVSVRTQRQTFIDIINSFFRLWASIESDFAGDLDYNIEGGKYARKLMLDCHSESAADVLYDYVNTFDFAMKEYISLVSKQTDASHAIERIYKQSIADKGIIL